MKINKFVCQCITAGVIGFSGNIAYGLEELELQPETFAAWFKNRGELVTDTPMLPVSINGGYLSFAAFDLESATQKLGKIKWESIELKLGIQYLATTKTEKNISFIEVVPMKMPLGQIKFPTKEYGSSDLIESEAAPLGRSELTRSMKKGDIITITLTVPEKSNESLASILKRGVALRISGHGGVQVMQVNFYTDSSSQEWAQCRISLRVKFSYAVPPLSLSPMVKPENNKYVTRKGNQFIYDGKPIRFSGVNLGDESLTYENIDNAVKRLANMNINAVRLWAIGYHFYTPESAGQKKMASAEKGDGSKLDRYDYLVAKLQEKGLFIHNTSLGSHTPPLEHWPDLPIRINRKKGISHYDHDFYTTAPILPYICPAYREVRVRHIKMYLNRINPYTGQRYADMPVFATWELTNENHMVAILLNGGSRKWRAEIQKMISDRWNEFLKDKYSTTEKLIAAWGSLKKGESLEEMNIKPAPVYDEVADYPEQRGMDYVNCIQQLFIKTNQIFEETARAESKPGIGINTAPIIHNTHADLNLHAHYASSFGDTLSCGVYQTPYTTDKSKPFYPWKPIFSERPYFYNLNYQTSKEKPFVIYEHSFFRPYDYRAEWIPALTLMGAGLGWDAIYLYLFGQKAIITDPSYSGLGFMSKRLLNPAATHHVGYTSGFHSGNDEVLMASLALTSQAFINGIAPNKESTEVIFGPQAYLSPGYHRYSMGKPAGEIPPGVSIAGGERELYVMPDIYRRFMQASVRNKLSVDFDPDQKTPIKIQGTLESHDRNNDTENLYPSSNIGWEPQKNRFRLDCAHSKLAVGILKDGIEFEDEFSLGVLSKNFAFFAISSRDGKPLKESEEIILTITSDAINTDYKFDPEKIGTGPLGHIQGVVDPGKAPVIALRPAGVLNTPLEGILRRYNFAGTCYSQETIKNGRIEFREDEPLFIAILSKK